MENKLEGKYLYANLALALFMDFIVQIFTFVGYLSGAGFFIAFFFGKLIQMAVIFTMFLFRYLHTANEVERYAKEKQAQIKALRQQASVLERVVAGIARKGEQLDVFFRQKLDKVKGMFAKAVMRMIIKNIFELIPLLNVVPLYTVSAIYDLWELRQERQNFQPVEAEIEALKDQVKNGDKIARKARKRASEQKANAKQKAEEAVQNRKSRQKAVEKASQTIQPRSI